MGDKIIHASEADFNDKVLQAEGPVLVDFWAPWCGPCKAIAPVLDAISEDYDGRLTIVKVNVDDAPAIAQNNNVRGIPTLTLFKDGEAAATKVGAISKSQLTAFIDSSL